MVAHGGSGQAAKCDMHFALLLPLLREKREGDAAELGTLPPGSCPGFGRPNGPNRQTRQFMELLTPYQRRKQ